MILVKVTSYNLSAKPVTPLTSGAVGRQVIFTLSSDWDGLQKIATFRAGAVSADVALLDDHCDVPSQCLAESNEELVIGLRGANGGGTVVIPTIWGRAGYIEDGATPSGVDPAEPEPDWTAQVQAAAAAALEKATAVEAAAARGDFDGEKGDKGDPGERGANYVTPEQYGAVGDGVNDDAPALQAALESGQQVLLTQDLYLKSKVGIVDRNVILDGCGHTLFIDGSGLSTDFDGMLKITSHIYADDEHPVRLVQDAVDVMYSGADKPFRRGYISYKGREPIPGENEEDYAALDIRSWDVHTAAIRNVTLSCCNCDGKAALMVAQMCHVRIENVSAICVDGYDGAIGISVQGCFNVRLNNCYASNWTATNTAHLSDLGYGLDMSGDDIIVSNCSADNCKHNFACGTSRSYFTTGLIVNNLELYTKYIGATRSDGSDRNKHLFDIHNAAVHPIINNLQITIENPTKRSGVTYMLVSCEECTITNLYCTSEEETGMMKLGGNCKLLDISNLHMPNGYIELDQSSGVHGWIRINGGIVRRLLKSKGLGKCVFRDLTITGFAKDFEKAEFYGCHFTREAIWESQATLDAIGDAVFYDCEIYGRREGLVDPARGFVAGDANTMRFYDCKFVCADSQTIFRANQFVHGCWRINFDGENQQELETDEKRRMDELEIRIEALERSIPPTPTPVSMILGAERLGDAVLG